MKKAISFILIFTFVVTGANGNINTKYDVGTYQYADNSHAVTGISSPVPGYTPPAFTLTGTSYHRPATLTLPGSPNKKIDFEYNPDNQRRKTLYYENNVLQKTMYYAGNYEKEVVAGGNINEYDYVYSPEGLAVIAIKTGGTRTRHEFQNKFAHDILMRGQKKPTGPFWFKKLPIKPSWYWYFGFGSGNTLW